MKIIVLLGAPGSGKGTQAKRLATTSGVVHFSTGDALRASIQEGTVVGKRAQVFMEKGELVPDSIMIELVTQTLAGVGGETKLLLDGFPRTLPQAIALDHNLETKVDQAIYFKMEKEELVKRLTGRRICEQCAEPFHIVFVPPRVEGRCDRCRGGLVQRTDDTESVVRQRLSVFATQNDSLLNYYNGSNRLIELDASLSIEVIHHQLLETI